MKPLSIKQLDAQDEAGDLVCPFCGDTGYDRVGLKHHLQQSCVPWNCTAPVDFVQTRVVPDGDKSL